MYCTNGRSSLCTANRATDALNDTGREARADNNAANDAAQTHKELRKVGRLLGDAHQQRFNVELDENACGCPAPRE